MSYNRLDKIIKVLLVTHYYPAHRGGVEIVAGKLAESLIQIQSSSITIQWMASDVDSVPKVTQGLTFLPMSASNWIEDKILIPYPIWSLSSLLKLWKGIDSVDVVHLHDYLYMSNLAAFVFTKIKNKPIIITQHIGFIPYNNPVFRGLLSFLNNTLGCAILRSVDQVIFISEVGQKYFSDKTRFRHPSLMIANGVDTDIFVPADESQRNHLRQALGLPNQQPIFLFVGRFVEKKGLPILQKLAKQFPSVYWVFAGWGSLDPETWNLPNVKVFRDRQGANLTPLYQAVDLFLLPSKGEGFPLVVQESMACGTPVMVGSETARAFSAAQHLMFSETVQGENVVLHWTRKIEHLLQDFQQVTSMREEVADFAHQHWSWTRCAQQYEKIFRTFAPR
jgi:glycosyltransferase involved in cell wall biosynthesis